MNLVYAGYMSTLDCIFLTYSRFFNRISLQRTAKKFIRGSVILYCTPVASNILLKN